MSARFSVEDYTAGLQAHLPRGLAWPREPDAVQTAVMAGLAGSFNRLDAAAVKLLADAFPATADGLLKEWEDSLGLPDPCAGEDPSPSSRLDQVVARFTDTGGQSLVYFASIAAALGFTVTFTEYRPWHVGDACELPLRGDDWAYAFTVNADDEVLSLLRAGDACEQPLADITLAAVLECVLNARKPSHTAILFNYA